MRWTLPAGPWLRENRALAPTTSLLFHFKLLTPFSASSPRLLRGVAIALQIHNTELPTISLCSYIYLLCIHVGCIKNSWMFGEFNTEIGFSTWQGPWPLPQLMNKVESSWLRWFRWNHHSTHFNFLRCAHSFPCPPPLPELTHTWQDTLKAVSHIPWKGGVIPSHYTPHITLCYPPCVKEFNLFSVRQEAALSFQTQHQYSCS